MIIYLLENRRKYIKIQIVMKTNSKNEVQHKLFQIYRIQECHAPMIESPVRKRKHITIIKIDSENNLVSNPLLFIWFPQCQSFNFGWFYIRIFPKKHTWIRFISTYTRFKSKITLKGGFK